MKNLTEYYRNTFLTSMELILVSGFKIGIENLNSVQCQLKDHKIGNSKGLISWREIGKQQ